MDGPQPSERRLLLIAVVEVGVLVLMALAAVRIFG